MRVELERRKEVAPSGDQDLPSCGATRARPMTQWTARPRCRLRVLLACRMLMPLRASRSIGLRAGRDDQKVSACALQREGARCTAKVGQTQTQDCWVPQQDEQRSPDAEFMRVLAGAQAAERRQGVAGPHLLCRR